MRSSLAVQSFLRNQSFWLRTAISLSISILCILSSFYFWTNSPSSFFILSWPSSSPAWSASFRVLICSLFTSCSCDFSDSCLSKSAFKVFSCCCVREISQAALAQSEDYNLRICCSLLASLSSKDFLIFSHQILEESAELMSSSILFPLYSFSKFNSLVRTLILLESSLFYSMT